MAKGGEFTFVLYSAALSVGLITPEKSATLPAIIILSMVMTPPCLAIHDRLMPKAEVASDGLPAPEDDGDAILLIGLGRFGQVVSQPLLTTGHRLSIIDSDPEMNKTVQTFGFKVYFGDAIGPTLLMNTRSPRARPFIPAATSPALTFPAAENAP